MLQSNEHLYLWITQQRNPRTFNGQTRSMVEDGGRGGGVKVRVKVGKINSDKGKVILTYTPPLLHPPQQIIIFMILRKKNFSFFSLQSNFLEVTPLFYLKKKNDVMCLQ